MVKEQTADPTAVDIFGILWRHKKKAFLFACATLVVVTMYLVVTPRKYSSEAKLFFRLGRENVGLDPTITSQVMRVQVTRDYEINSAIEMMTSRTLLGKAVDVLGVDALDATPAQPAWVVDMKTRMTALKQEMMRRLQLDPAEGTGEADVREVAIQTLQQNLHVTSPPQTTVIRVAYEGASPQLAQRIVNTVVDVYVGEHMRLHRAAGSLEFFVQQVELQRQALEEADRKLSDLKSCKDVVSIEGQLQLLEAQKLEIEQEQLRVHRQLASSTERHRALAESVQSLDEMVLAQRVEGVANEATDGMRQQLYDLQIREQDLLANLTEDYPLVKPVRRQVESLRSILEAEARDRKHSTIAVNPNWRQLQLSLLQEASELAALGASKRLLEQQRTELAQKIKDLNGYAIQVAQMQREADLLAENYKAYSMNLEQARIDAATENRRISNVSVVQEATLSPKPVSPQKRLIAGLGLFVALFGGAGLAFAWDYFDPRLKSPSEIEQALGLPVLVSIPRASRQSVHV